MSCEKTFARFLLHILYLLFRRFRGRIFKEFLFFRHFQYFSMIHEDHLIGNSLCLSQIMCDDDESILVFQLQKRFSIAIVFFISSAEHGSSRSRISGPAQRLRAIARRCF